MADNEGRLQELRDLTAHSAKDYERISQQIKNLKENSKQDAKTFEAQLKEMVLAGEKKKQAIETQLAAKDRRTIIHSPQNELLKAQADHTGGSCLGSTNKGLTIDGINSGRLTLEAHRKQEEDFRKLVSATGIDDVSQLIDCFIQMEEDNFKEFRYINEITFEIQDLESQIASLRNDRNELEEQVTANDKEREAARARTESEKQSLIAQRERVYQANEETEARLKEILKEVCNIFYIIGADNLLEKTVLKNDFIRVDNLPEIFRTVENRFLEMVYAYSTITNSVS